MKNIYLILLLNSLFVFSQKHEKTIIHSFEEVEKLHQQNQKPLLVFVYTEWCKICFGMKKTTFQDKGVSSLLNKHFYVIFFNAETEKEIEFFGKYFQNKPSGMHELATILATKNNQIAYPTITLLNKEFEIKLQLQGFTKGTELTSILNSFLKKENGS